MNVPGNEWLAMVIVRGLSVATCDLAYSEWDSPRRCVRILPQFAVICRIIITY